MHTTHGMELFIHERKATMTTMSSFFHILLPYVEAELKKEEGFFPNFLLIFQLLKVAHNFSSIHFTLGGKGTGWL